MWKTAEAPVENFGEGIFTEDDVKAKVSMIEHRVGFDVVGKVLKPIKQKYSGAGRINIPPVVSGR